VELQAPIWTKAPAHAMQLLQTVLAAELHAVT